MLSLLKRIVAVYIMIKTLLYCMHVLIYCISTVFIRKYISMKILNDFIIDLKKAKLRHLWVVLNKIVYHTSKLHITSTNFKFGAIRANTEPEGFCSILLKSLNLLSRAILGQFKAVNSKRQKF